MGVCRDASVDEQRCPTTSCGKQPNRALRFAKGCSRFSHRRCCATIALGPPTSCSIGVYHAQLVDPLTFNVLGINGSFRESAVTEFFNPTNTTPPFFQVFDSGFLKILGPNATIRAVAANPGFAFAHEAPIWNPKTDEVFFASQDGGALGFSDIDHNNRVSKINLGEVAQAIQKAGPGAPPVNVTVTKVRASKFRCHDIIVVR